MNTGSTSNGGGARFARRVAGTLVVRVLIIASSFLSGVIIARWLGSDGVGVWASLNVILLLAITIGGFGLQSTVTLFVARDRDKARPVLINALLFGLIAGCFFAVLIVAVTVGWPGILGGVPPRLVMIAAVALPFQMMSYFCLGFYLGLERIRSYNLIDAVMQGFVLINAAVTLVAFSLGIEGLVIVNTIVNAAISLVVVWFAIRETGTHGKARWDRILMSEMLGNGLRFFLAIAASVIILRGDLLIVNYFRGTAEAGIYAIATQASLLTQMVPNIVATILFPRTSAVAEPSGELTCRVTRHAAFLLTLLCLTAAPFAFLLPMLYGQGFASVPWLFLILLPGVLALGVETVQVQHFAGLGLPRQIPMFWLITMVLNICLNVLLVPAYGAMGAACVSTLSYLVMFVCVAAFFSTKTGRSFSDMFIIRRDEIAGLFRLHKPIKE